MSRGMRRYSLQASTLMPNTAPQYKQFARVGGFALEHEGHGDQLARGKRARLRRFDVVREQLIVESRQLKTSSGLYTRYERVFGPLDRRLWRAAC